MASTTGQRTFMKGARTTASHVPKRQFKAVIAPGSRVVNQQQVAKLQTSLRSAWKVFSLSSDQEAEALQRQVVSSEEKEKAAEAAMVEETPLPAEAEAPPAPSEASKQPLLSTDQEAAALQKQMMKSMPKTARMDSDAEAAALQKQMMKSMPKTARMDSDAEAAALQKQMMKSMPKTARMDSDAEKKALDRQTTAIENEPAPFTSEAALGDRQADRNLAVKCALLIEPTMVQETAVQETTFAAHSSEAALEERQADRSQWIAAHRAQSPVEAPAAPAASDPSGPIELDCGSLLFTSDILDKK
ncbi:hypothetical protein CYMTET_28676 [Cymbomonas tetramitiformis]|uniref:Uncharacterized protein n=1 Tax=Cymbomonas tetramitiformis TaxID=36881 RepID=A0AAE0KW01_9CHLO|nr:hypothetical protein CYMTET_28676 [Cymbomonas tetramitiformis]